MSVKHIAFTAYPVKDMARARRFYEEGLGLTVGSNFRDEWVEYYLDNGCFAISTMFEGKGGGIAFEVDDVDQMAAVLKKAGAKLEMEPFSTPVCRNAILQDPDGNTFGLHLKNEGR